MDDLRLVVIMGAVVVHIIGTYGVDVGWYARGRPLPEPVILVLAGPVWAGLLWGLAPLFVLAGWSAAGSVVRHGVLGFLRRRSLRLGLPLALYVLVLDPVTAFLAGWAGQGRDPLPALWRRLTTGTGHDLGPAWFLLVLVGLSLVLALSAAAAPSLCVRRTGPDRSRAIVASAAAVACGTALLDAAVWARWPYTETSPWNLDVAHWPQATGAFVLGVLAFRGRWLETLPRATSRLGGAAALGALAGLAGIAAVVMTSAVDYRALAGGWHATTLAFGLADGTVAVGFGLWSAGFFRTRRLRGSQSPAAWLSRGAYATYLLHPPVVVAVAAALQLTDWPAVAQLLMLLTVALPGSVLLGTGAARLPVLHRIL